MPDVANQMRKLRDVLLAEPRLHFWAKWCEAAADELEREVCHYCERADGHAPDCPNYRCPACSGNDASMPCAYPSGGQPGCLRDRRLSTEREVRAQLETES